jgi:hypothetical protein
MDVTKLIIPFIAFMILANPALFKVVRGIAGGWVASADGLATLPGLALHAAIFALILPHVSGFKMGNETRRMRGAFKKATEKLDGRSWKEGTK